VLRPALLWNDVRSAPQAQELVDHFSADQLANLTGSVPLASFTSTKLLWLSQNEPEIAAQVAAVLLPHDWLSWRLSEDHDNLAAIFTDPSDASGTGYFNPQTNSYIPEILDYCGFPDAQLPRVIEPGQLAAKLRSDLFDNTECVIAAGMGDNAGAAYGLGLGDGELAVSLGTSGTVFGYSKRPSSDSSGVIAGFSNAQGGFLPLVCTLNAARVIEWGASLLGVNLDEFSDLALKAPAGCGGVSVVPYLEGERTPNLPNATASVLGLTLQNGSRENFARACIEGMLGSLKYGIEVIEQAGHSFSQLYLIGGAAQSPAVREVAKELFGITVVVPEPAEYVALGAAKQAADLVRN
jgi:xylulokinase